VKRRFDQQYHKLSNIRYPFQLISGEAVRGEATKAEPSSQRLDRSQQGEAGGRHQAARNQRQEEGSQQEEGRNTEVNDGKDVKKVR
jgi:hypothetical protein